MARHACRGGLARPQRPCQLPPHTSPWTDRHAFPIRALPSPVCRHARLGVLCPRGCQACGSHQLAAALRPPRLSAPTAIHAERWRPPAATARADPAGCQRSSPCARQAGLGQAQQPVCHVQPPGNPTAAGAVVPACHVAAAGGCVFAGGCGAGNRGQCCGGGGAAVPHRQAGEGTGLGCCCPELAVK